jgi:hypothetical protein
MLPLFLLLMWVIRRDIARVPARADLWVRKWVLVFTIFIAGLTVAIDLITLINTFLGGEVTIRFFIKVAIVLLVATGVFLHFLADMWGFWDKQPQQARMVSTGVGILAVLTIAAGFLIIGTPSQIRAYRFDDEKITDLQQIQSEIISYWQQKGVLPSSLGDINNSVNGMVVPHDVQTNAPYEYRLISAHAFQICAVFNAETQWNSSSLSAPMIPYPSGVTIHDNSWWHGAGHTCFDRTIDPQLYAPVGASSKVVPQPILPVR